MRVRLFTALLVSVIAFTYCCAAISGIENKVITSPPSGTPSVTVTNTSENHATLTPSISQYIETSTENSFSPLYVLLGDGDRVSYTFHFDSTATEWRFSSSILNTDWTPVLSPQTTILSSEHNFSFNELAEVNVYLYVRSAYGEETIAGKILAVGRSPMIHGPFASQNEGYAPLNRVLFYSDYPAERDIVSQAYAFSTSELYCGELVSFDIPGTYTLHYYGIAKIPFFGNEYAFYCRKPDYFRVHSRSEADEYLLPGVKVFPGQTLTAYDLKDYKPYNQEYGYVLTHNPLNMVTLNGTTVVCQGFGIPTTATAQFAMTYEGDTIRTLYGKVNVSSYQLRRLPEISLAPGETKYVNVGDYCYNAQGLKLAPSFGKAGSLVVSPSSQLKAEWIGNILVGYGQIKITASSDYTGDGYVEVIASSSDKSPWPDSDRERIVVHANPQMGTALKSSSEMQKVLVFQPLEGANSQPQVTVPISGIMRVKFTSQNQGIKIMPALNLFRNYEKGKWYIARMKVRTDNKDSLVNTQLVHLKGVVPNDVHIEAAVNCISGLTTDWTLVETPIYTHQSGSGYFQIMLENQGDACNVYVKDLEWIEAKPGVMSLRGKSPEVKKEVVTDYYVLKQPWSMDNQNAHGIYDYNGFIITPKQQYTNDITLTSINEDYTVMTPGVPLGNSFGMKSQIRNITGSADQFTFLMACMGVPEEGLYDISSKGTQIVASAEWGQLTDNDDPVSQGYHYLAGNALQPWYQFQVKASGTTDGDFFYLYDVRFMPGEDKAFYMDSSLM